MSDQKCHRCERVFETVGEYVDHMKSSTIRFCVVSGVYYCNLCDKSYTRRSSMYSHSDNTHQTASIKESVYTYVEGDEYPYHCSSCDKKYKNQSSSSIHYRKVHKVDVKGLKNELTVSKDKILKLQDEVFTTKIEMETLKISLCDQPLKVNEEHHAKLINDLRDQITTLMEERDAKIDELTNQIDVLQIRLAELSKKDQPLTVQYVYLVKRVDFVESGQNIYKIGKTKRANYARFNEYPKGSILIHQYSCRNCDTVESEIIRVFKGKFCHRKEYGSEYFEGDMLEMDDTISAIIASLGERIRV